MSKNLQEEINKRVNKVIKIMKDNKDKISKGNIYVLDMNKGFLFYNTTKGWLYHGMSLVSEPNYLSGEVKRTPKIINYTTGKTRAGNFLIHEDIGIEDLDKLYNVIINCE
jgi:hypothetical protein